MRSSPSGHREAGQRNLKGKGLGKAGFDKTQKTCEWLETRACPGSVSLRALKW